MKWLFRHPRESSGDLRIGRVRKWSGGARDGKVNVGQTVWFLYYPLRQLRSGQNCSYNLTQECRAGRLLPFRKLIQHIDDLIQPPTAAAVSRGRADRKVQHPNSSWIRGKQCLT